MNNELVVSGPQILIGLGLGITLLIFMMLKTKVHPFLAMIISASITGLVGGMPAGDVVNSITTGGLGITLLIFMMLKTKVHPFLAMIISASITGLVGGMPAGDVVNSITTGFGNTLGSIGIIIGFGVMMGEIFEVSGAAKKMAQIFVEKLGKGREELALAITGFLVSIPIFCDSGFVILSPLAKSISRNTKKSVISLGLSLALGLVITHTLVPPTPGPVGVAGIYGANVGTTLLLGIVCAIPMTLVGLLYAKYIGHTLVPPTPGPVGVAGIYGANVGTTLLLGIVCAIPMTLVGLLYAKYIGKKQYKVPSEDGESYLTSEDLGSIAYDEAAATLIGTEEVLPSAVMSFMPIFVPIGTEEVLPSAVMSFMPIFVPIILILMKTVTTQMGLTGGAIEVINFLGAPVIAVGLGLIIAIYGLGKDQDKKEITNTMEKGIKSAGVIMLVTGAGGALGMIIRVKTKTKKKLQILWKKV